MPDLANDERMTWDRGQGQIRANRSILAKWYRWLLFRLYLSLSGKVRRGCESLNLERSGGRRALLDKPTVLAAGMRAGSHISHTNNHAELVVVSTINKLPLCQGWLEGPLFLAA